MVSAALIGTGSTCLQQIRLFSDVFSDGWHSRVSLSIGWLGEALISFGGSVVANNVESIASSLATAPVSVLSLRLLLGQFAEVLGLLETVVLCALSFSLLKCMVFFGLAGLV